MATRLDIIGDLLSRPGVQQAVDIQVNKMAGGSPVDLDLTMGIYLVLFLGAWILLKYLLFDPYLKVKEKRDAGIGGRKEEAAAMESRAEEKIAEYNDALDEARAEAGELRQQLKAEGHSEEQEILEVAYGEASETLKAGREELEDQVEEAREELRQKAEDLSELIAGRLLPSS